MLRPALTLWIAGCNTFDPEPSDWASPGFDDTATVGVAGGFGGVPSSVPPRVSPPAPVLPPPFDAGVPRPFDAAAPPLPAADGGVADQDAGADAG
jgi:hypothetical protein